MARRGGSASESISLFPFLSILVCVIGVLTLMIAGSSFSEIGTKPDPEAQARTKEFRELNARLAEDRKALEAVRAQIDGSSFGQVRLDAAEQQIAELRQQKEKLEEEAKARQAALDLVRERDLLKVRVDELKKEIETRQQAVEELDQEIDQKGKPPEAVVSIRPSGSGKNLDATFVECTDSGVTILKEPASRVRAGDLAVDPKYLELLEHVASSKDGILIFLVRENAIGTYATARGIALREGIRNGKLPVVGQGKIDLSMFERATKRRDREEK